MNFSAWSILNPIPAILLFAMLTFGGLLAFERLPVQYFPDMDLPRISISATLEGTAPTQLETEVARVIEDRLASLSNLDHIATTIADGTVSIDVTFELERNSDEVLNEVRNAVDSVKPDLPAQMQTPSVTKISMQSAPLVTYAVRSSSLNETELSWFVDNNMTKALLSVAGVGQVSRFGGIDREVHVDLDPGTMASLGVTAAAVSEQLKSVQADTSGGIGEIGGTRQTLRTLGAVASVENLKGLQIPLANGQQVRLDDVASVNDSFADRSSLAYLDGQPVIAVAVKRSNGFSDTGVAADVAKAMQQFAAEHPGVQIDEIYSRDVAILDSYQGSMHMLFEGGSWPSWSCGSSYGTGARRSYRPSHCRCPSYQPSSPCTSPTSVLISLPCLHCRWWSAYLSTMPSWRSRTSLAISRWANGRLMPPSKPPMRSG
ncbi:nodulation protein NolG (plasmid) [Sinorhizobium americanum]|uniref:Nodulation protein NolG n=1 Tax=Sinorhizobium americanum TaxID=194963 RepID=A0A1L3LU41_9HYPH|nr:nodulation protein NolG [Sinorhizobium americanum]